MSGPSIALSEGQRLTLLRNYVVQQYADASAGLTSTAQALVNMADYAVFLNTPGRLVATPQVFASLPSTLAIFDLQRVVVGDDLSQPYNGRFFSGQSDPAATPGGPNTPLGGIVRSTAGSVTSTVLNNVVAGNPIFNGLAGNITTGIGSYLGSYLAHQIVTPQTQAGAVGGSIGGALGSFGAIAAYGTVAFAELTAGIGTAIAVEPVAYRSASGASLLACLQHDPAPRRGDRSPRTPPRWGATFDIDGPSRGAPSHKGRSGGTKSLWQGAGLAPLAAWAANDNTLTASENAA